MKNCDEMVSSLLQRRADYEVKKKARRQMVMRISTMACTLALVLFIGTGMNQGWWLTQEPEIPTVTPTQHQPTAEPIQPDVQVPTEGPTVQPTQPNVTEPVDTNHIVIHDIESISGGMMYIALMRDDFVSMKEAELVDYYGTEFVPEVPEDLADLQRESYLGIYRRDGGTGEVYHDEQRLTWTTEDQTRGISVTVRKDQLPYQFFALLTEEFEASIIQNVEVGIGRTEEGTWLAEFLYKNVGFRIVAEGLNQEELVAVIVSLIR